MVLLMPSQASLLVFQGLRLYSDIRGTLAGQGPSVQQLRDYSKCLTDKCYAAGSVLQGRDLSAARCFDYAGRVGAV